MKHHSPYKFELRGEPFQITVLFIWIFIMAGFFLPETFWGLHHIAFIPRPTGYLLMGVVTVLLLSSSSNIKISWFSSLYLATRERYLLIICLSISFGLIYYHHPIVADYYGNARSFIPQIDKVSPGVTADFYSRLFSLRFEPGHGRKGVLMVYQFFSYVFNVRLGTIFLLSDAIFGGLFIFTWLVFITKKISQSGWWLILALLGLSAPFMLIFMGHIETYAPVYFILLLYLVLLSFWHKSRNKDYIPSLIILQVIGLRMHNLFILLLPIIALILLHHYWPRSRLSNNLSSIRGLLLYIFAPICGLGAVLYFVILQDFKDPRRLDHTADIERLFLPIISPDPPLERYNLLSLNHILDYLNLIMSWSPLLLLLLVYFGKVIRKNKIKPSLLISLLVLATILFLTFFFVFNPLMSMPMDWDLFVFPAIVLAVLVVNLAAEQNFSPPAPPVLLASFGCILICLPPYIVHQDLESMSYRYEDIGIHVNRTYYEHSAAYILNALQLIPDDPGLYQARKKRVIQKLKKDAIPGNDWNYASLLTDEGLNKLQFLNDYESAMKDFEAALFYNPKAYENILYLIQCDLATGAYPGALAHAIRLEKLHFPNQLKSIRILIYCAIKAGDVELATMTRNKYEDLIESDKIIDDLFKKVANSENIGTLTPLLE